MNLKPRKYILHLTGIWNYMEGIRLSVKDLNQRVVKSQENVATIIKLINKWNEMPLFRRIDRERTEPLLDIEGKELKDIFCLVMRYCTCITKRGPMYL